MVDGGAQHEHDHHENGPEDARTVELLTPMVGFLFVRERMLRRHVRKGQRVSQRGSHRHSQYADRCSLDVLSNGKRTIRGTSTAGNQRGTMRGISFTKRGKLRAPKRLEKKVAANGPEPVIPRRSQRLRMERRVPAARTPRVPNLAEMG